MISRSLTPHVVSLSKVYPVVSVTGPRQSGKTTLCRAAFPKHQYVNLEAEDHGSYARDDPRGFLAEYSSGVVIDEVQRAPDLLGFLQEEVDRDATPGRFVLTGSQHFALSQQISQSLAGRIGLTQLLPPSRQELVQFPDAPEDLLTTLWSGSYPRIYDRGIAPQQWLRDYYTTYVQRDVRQVLAVSDLERFSTFVRLCAGRTACELNLSQLGADSGVTHHTARSWLSVLETSFLCLRVPAFHTNVRKQLVKSPKIHFVDTGLVCFLLGIRTADELRHHPLRGAIFESWVCSEIAKLRLHSNQDPCLRHFRVNRGLEVDLILDEGGRLLLVEAKSGATLHTDSYRNLKAFRKLFEEDERDITAFVIHGGDTRQTRTTATALPWHAIDEAVKPVSLDPRNTERG